MIAHINNRGKRLFLSDTWVVVETLTGRSPELAYPNPVILQEIVSIMGEDIDNNI